MDSLKFLLFVAVAACTVKVSLQRPNKRRLYKDLMSDYNPLERPVSDESQTVTVELGLSLMQIMDLDEKNQVLTTKLWLRMFWDDYHLQWNTSDYPGVSDVSFPDHLIWKPDIVLSNSADERFDASYHTNILVKSTGSCFYQSLEVTGRKEEKKYACCPEPYPDVTYTVVMRRRTLYYCFNLLIPCVLISTLALLVFLLPADSGEKTSLGITVMLSLMVFMLLVAEIMPATSDSVPLIAQYFATTKVIVGLSVIATVLVLQYHHHDPDGSKMPKWTHVFLLNWCAWFLRMKRPGEERVRPACHNNVPRSSLTSMELNVNASAPQSTNCNMLYVGSRGLESIHHTTAAPSPDSGILCGQLIGRGGEDEVLLPTGQSSSVGNVEPELAKILDEVRYIAKHFRNQDEYKSVRNEWKFAAAVIDRLCLMAFSLFTILCTIGILMSAPNFVEAISKDFFG
ncbi:neuronal acetylcholine receptor subunit alpha-7-like isoform X2 [Thunnus maccoyii]|uniref:neuronal acetylcholine receptor subunit alpha-7-like isoform X2 n=1 Tax=Thunnus maccoyii TaxID=8240 RepID=UPI001C4C1F9D|nr:neuronal acetylcholine receptor subunit alpha-7-like isoform X2 [Thunnus maccoyii]